MYLLWWVNFTESKLWRVLIAIQFIFDLKPVFCAYPQGSKPAASRCQPCPMCSISSSCVALLAEPRYGLFLQPRLHSTAQHKRRRSRPLAGRCLVLGGWSWAGSAQRVLLLFNPVSLYLLVVNLSPLLWSPRIWNARPNVIVHTLKALTIAHSFYYIYLSQKVQLLWWD